MLQQSMQAHGQVGQSQADDDRNQANRVFETIHVFNPPSPNSCALVPCSRLFPQPAIDYRGLGESAANTNAGNRVDKRVWP
jgi:hypothetical protein